MNDVRKTIGFAAAALVLALGAVFAVPRHGAPPEGVSEEGQPFYPDFTDPQRVAALEIVEYDEATAVPKPFKVERKDGRWIIPSHYDYPADAQDRLAKVAARLVGLRKDVFRTARHQEHEACGVLDPLDEKSTSLKGMGRRVTLRDAEGRVLADYVFGRETGNGMRYVRLPRKHPVYATKTNAEISSSFGDWIETDLLKLAPTSLRKIAFDLYTIDEVNMRMNDNRTQFELVRTESLGPWKLGDQKETEEVNAEVLTAMENALDDLRIVGVRPKPEELRKVLRGEPNARLGAAEQHSLRTRGYFLTRQGDLLSNEGQVSVSCDDGVVYMLRFGELLFGTGEEVTKGSEPKDPAAPDKKDDNAPEKGPAENRYLFVDARFDEHAVGAAPAPPADLTPDPAWTEEQKKQEEAKHKQAREEYERKKKEHDDKVAAGRKRAAQLAARFADWYYVISAESYGKIRKTRADVARPKAPDAPGPNVPPPPKHDGHDHKDD